MSCEDIIIEVPVEDITIETPEEVITVEVTPEGKDGASATVTVGTVETLDPEQQAYVENVGTELNAILNFGIPKGADSGSPLWGSIIGTMADQTDLMDALDAKADADDVYTKSETDDLLDDKADADEVYTKTESDALLDEKADADAVYTKSEADDLLADKADADTVYTKTETDALLADKADTADLGALASKDSVDYQTEVTNKPNLGSLATKNSVDYSTEVTNKPTLGSLAGKNSVSYATEVTDKPTLGALAAKNSVDYSSSEVTNKPTLGDLAALDSIDYEGNLITNKPTLGDLADHDTVDYATEVTNKPTLGSLASQNTVDYTTEVTNTPSLGSMAAVNDAPSDSKEYVRKNGAWTESSGGGGGAAAWGSISGTLSDQTDLNNALSGKQSTLTFDSSPTQNSNNPVTSGGVYSALLEGFRDVYKVTLPSVSSAKLSFTVPGITTDHVLIVEGYIYISDRSAVTSIQKITTGTDSITITGTLTGTTDIIVTLGIPRTITGS